MNECVSQEFEFFVGSIVDLFIVLEVDLVLSVHCLIGSLGCRRRGWHHMRGPLTADLEQWRRVTQYKAGQ